MKRAIAWLAAKDNRRVPHRGVIANNLWLHHRAAGLNHRQHLTPHTRHRIAKGPPGPRPDSPQQDLQQPSSPSACGSQ